MSGTRFFVTLAQSKGGVGSRDGRRVAEAVDRLDLYHVGVSCMARMSRLFGPHPCTKKESDQPHLGRVAPHKTQAPRRSRVSPQHAEHAGSKPPKSTFLVKTLLLAHPTQLAESFPMGPCSTFGDKNSLRYDLGPHHCDCHVSTH
jgi:hypothetical protein